VPAIVAALPTVKLSKPQKLPKSKGIYQRTGLAVVSMDAPRDVAPGDWLWWVHPKPIFVGVTNQPDFNTAPAGVAIQGAKRGESVVFCFEGQITVEMTREFAHVLGVKCST
jgi:hypothetical protein